MKNCYFCSAKLIKVETVWIRHVCRQHGWAETNLQPYKLDVIHLSNPDQIFWSVTIKKTVFEIRLYPNDNKLLVSNTSKDMRYLSDTVLFLDFIPNITPENSAQKLKVYLPFL